MKCPHVTKLPSVTRFACIHAIAGNDIMFEVLYSELNWDEGTGYDFQLMKAEEE